MKARKKMIVMRMLLLDFGLLGRGWRICGAWSVGRGGRRGLV
jgi:hypothetical protein